MSESLQKWYKQLNPLPDQIISLKNFSDPQGRNWIADKNGNYQLEKSFFELRTSSIADSEQEVAVYELPAIIQEDGLVRLCICREFNDHIQFLLQFKPQVSVPQCTIDNQDFIENLKQNNILFVDPKNNNYVLDSVSEIQRDQFRWIGLEELLEFKKYSSENIQCPRALSEFIRLWAMDYLTPKVFVNV